MTLLSKTPVDTISAEDLLAIAIDAPEALFSGANADIIKKEFRALVKHWHPDRNKNPKANQVIAHLKKIQEQAEQKLAKNAWEIPNLLRFETNDHKKIQIRYFKKMPFELGQTYIADESVTYVLDKADKDLFDNAKNIISNFKFPNNDLAKKFEGVLPKIKHTFETPDKLIMMLKKDPDDILLTDVLAHYKQKLDPKHAAWIGSRLHNISCYLEWAGLTHNALTTDNCFISPKNHSVNLAGGWWFVAKEGDKLKALPPKTTAIAPPSLFAKPIASKRLDLALIRATGREILGDATGMSFSKNKDIPAPITTWVNAPSSGNAVEDYRIWLDEVLPKAFGARRFTEMKLTPNDIYKP